MTAEDEVALLQVGNRNREAWTMRQSFKGANGPPLGALLQGGPVMRGELNDAPTATAAPASSSCAAWCFRNQKAPHSGALCTAYGGEIGI
jgi:hypothetical protein